MDADERTLVVLMDGRVLGRVYYDRSKRVRLHSPIGDSQLTSRI